MVPRGIMICFNRQHHSDICRVFRPETKIYLRINFFRKRSRGAASLTQPQQKQITSKHTSYDNIKYHYIHYWGFCSQVQQFEDITARVSSAYSPNAEVLCPSSVCPADCMLTVGWGEKKSHQVYPRTMRYQEPWAARSPSWVKQQSLPHHSLWLRYGQWRKSETQTDKHQTMGINYQCFLKPNTSPYTCSSCNCCRP